MQKGQCGVRRKIETMSGRCLSGGGYLERKMGVLTALRGGADKRGDENARQCAAPERQGGARTGPER